MSKSKTEQRWLYVTSDGPDIMCDGWLSANGTRPVYKEASGQWEQPPSDDLIWLDTITPAMLSFFGITIGGGGKGAIWAIPIGEPEAVK